MSGHPLWPDDLEKLTTALVRDLTQREPVLAAKLETLLDLAIAELAAWKAIRERLFHP